TLALLVFGCSLVVSTPHRGREGWETMKRRSKPGALVLGILVVALLLPAGLATGTGWKNKDKGGSENVVLLTLGKSNHVQWGSLEQAISSKGGCNKPSLGKRDILDVTAGGGSLTLKNDGFGVKAQTAWGCDTVDKGESLTVSMGKALEGLIMSALDVDLAVSKYARIEISFRRDGAEVASATFQPGVYKDGTNVRYFSRPMSGGKPIFFDEVVFKAKKGWFS